jgi:uncharacterized protein (DUF1800 family)
LGDSFATTFLVKLRRYPQQDQLRPDYRPFFRIGESTMPSLKGLTAAGLCLSLAWPSVPGLAQTPAVGDSSHQRARKPYKSSLLQGDQRILHTLNRFTFGPRPGDLETVRAIGLDKWFEQQLRPESLDLSDLDARLAQFPAMQWKLEDLLYRLPSKGLIRQTIDGKAPVPQGEILRAVYENEIDRVSARREAQEQKKQAEKAGVASGGAPAADGDTSETSTPPMKQPAPAQTGSPDMDSMNLAKASPQGDTAPSADGTLFNSPLALPPRDRVMRLVAMNPREFDGFFDSLRPGQRALFVADLNPDQREVVAALKNPERLVAEELIAQRLTRDIYSTAQLQEVMTDFWFNHFNVYLRKNGVTPYYLVTFERDVIRPLALGKFEDLLEATAHSPAMLVYLDNAESVGPDSLAAQRALLASYRRPGNQKKAHEGLNENYARELMELHTLGVNGGYTQTDVTQVARILTGWTVERPLRGGGFEFDPNRHEPGTKKALGQKFKENGEMEGRELLHYLATQPATAQFICRKIATRFVSDDPSQSLVDRMARSYLSSGGDISAVLRTLYRSPEFWSTDVYHAKVKTPLEYVVSAVRASDANIDSLRPLANALHSMGMPLYGCIPPTGYSWQASAWVSTGALVDRMNFAISLAANKLPGITTAWSPQTDESAGSAISTGIPSPEAEELRLELLVDPGGVSDSTRTAVLQQFQQQSASNQDPRANQPMRAAAFHAQPTALERQDQILAGLLLGSPEFQRR